MAEDQNSWAMWVGAGNYPTIEDFVKEAKKLGISKKVTNLETARKLKNPDTIIFLIHDESKFIDCEDCLGKIECEVCRKRLTREETLHSQLKQLKINLQAAKVKNSTKGLNRATKAIRIRLEELKRLSVEHEFCPCCDQDRKSTAGTGGHIKLKNGKVIDRRTIKYWVRHPWKPVDLVRYYKKQIVEDFTCKKCSGSGKIPDSKVFGFFIPERLEYILRDDDSQKLKNYMSSDGFDVIIKKEVSLEEKRKCGYRQQGAIYLVAKKENKKTRIKMLKVLQELITTGCVERDDVKIEGNFCHFTKPLNVKLKRFRGIKRWEMEIL